MQLLSCVAILLLLSWVNCEPMNLHLLTSTTAVCSDGTHAGYYFRKGNSTDRWIIYLEGGGYCYDETSCKLRWQYSPGLMTNKHWGPSMGGSGILSPEASVNPYWYNTNMIYIPYCTSDSFCGSQPKSNINWAFMGSHVVEQIVQHFLTVGLEKAKEVTFSGSSAGAEGLWANADRVGKMLPAGVNYKILSDSGWFLDDPPYRQQDCQQLTSCTEAEALRRGFMIWNPRVNDACHAAKTPGTEWQCMLGPYAFPYVKAPTFVFAFRFDAAGLGHDGLGMPKTPAELAYAAAAANNVTKSFTTDNVKAVFSASCFHHTVEGDNNWGKLRINGNSYMDAAYDFVKNGRMSINIDTCNTPNCNPTCQYL